MNCEGNGMNHLIALIEDGDGDAGTYWPTSNAWRRIRASVSTFAASETPTLSSRAISRSTKWSCWTLTLARSSPAWRAAKLLRKMDSETFILFVASLAQYAVDGYEVSALDFMVKPVNFATFRRKLNRALAHGKRTVEQDIMLKLIYGYLLFARCHRSFLVNLSFVKGFHGQVVMVDNEELPIARMKRQEFLEAPNKYLGGGI